MIEKNKCSEPMKKVLPRALGLNPNVVEDAFEITARQKQEELELDRKRQEEYERKTFQPHLWIQHKLSRPRSIAMVTLSGVNTFKLVRLPEGTNQLSWDEQKRIVRWAIQLHQQDKGIEDIMFGKVTGYGYRQTYDSSHLFSMDGELLEMNYEIKKP